MSVSFDDYCLAKQKCKNKTKKIFLLILITKLSSTRFFFCLPKPKNGHQLKFLKGQSLSFLLKQSSVINLFTYLHPSIHSYFIITVWVLSLEAGLGLLVSESLESVWGQGFDVCVCIILTAAEGQALRPAHVSG